MIKKVTSKLRTVCGPELVQAIYRIDGLLFYGCNYSIRKLLYCWLCLSHLFSYMWERRQFWASLNGLNGSSIWIEYNYAATRELSCFRVGWAQIRVKLSTDVHISELHRSSSISRHSFLTSQFQCGDHEVSCLYVTLVSQPQGGAHFFFFSIVSTFSSNVAT